MVKKVCFMGLVMYIMFFVLLFTGCATTSGHRADSQPAVLEHYGKIKAVEGELDYYIGRIDAAAEQLEHIRSRQGEQGEAIDAIIREFEEYQYSVQLLLRYYKELRDRIKGSEEGKPTAENNAGYYDYYFHSACDRFLVQEAAIIDTDLKFML